MVAHASEARGENRSETIRKAIIKVGMFKPSFLILDVVMPRLDGLEVCRRL
jgi:DNA-binding response OmpR family regulator